MTFSDRNTIELMSSSGKKIRVLKKAYRYLIKKPKDVILEITDTCAIFRYSSGEIRLNDLSKQIIRR